MHFDGLRTKLLLKTFYDFLIRHFKKNVKSHVFLKSEKTIKYVFSNTGYQLSLVDNNANLHQIFIKPCSLTHSLIK